MNRDDNILIFLNHIKNREYESAYGMIDSLDDPELTDIIEFYKLQLEMELGLFEKALESFFSKKWMAYADNNNYIRTFNYFLYNKNLIHKESIMLFIKSHYSGNTRNQAMLDYALYLKKTNNIPKQKEALNYIISQRGNTWQKREAFRMLYDIEEISKMNNRELKDRISICLDLRLLNIAEHYIDYMQRERGLSKYDYNIMLAELYHRLEDYERSLYHYLTAHKHLSDRKESSRLHFRILLRYLYLGLFDDALTYFDNYYNSLENEYKAHFLLTRLRILSQQGRLKDAEQTYRKLLNDFPRYRNNLSVAQLTLASYLILNSDSNRALTILSKSISNLEDYRQNRLLLQAIIHTENKDTERSLSALQEILKINSSSNYASFVLDMLNGLYFDIHDIKQYPLLFTFYNSHKSDLDFDFISTNYKLTQAQSSFLKLAWELQQIGIIRFLEVIRDLPSSDMSLKNSLDRAMSFINSSFYDEALYILSAVNTTRVERDINNAIFLARIYLISRHKDPNLALRLIESNNIVKNKDIPAVILPRFMKIALYPYRYLPEILKYLTKTGISPFFVLAIMREESRFNPTVVSWAGAIGLMQLLEETAGRYIEGDSETILEKDTNIRIGIEYISELFNEFNALDYVAISYNAGEKRKRLLYTEIDHPLRYFLLSNIAWFSETRHYLRKVWSSYLHYQIIYEDLIRDSLRMYYLRLFSL